VLSGPGRAGPGLQKDWNLRARPNFFWPVHISSVDLNANQFENHEMTAKD